MQNRDNLNLLSIKNESVIQSETRDGKAGLYLFNPLILLHNQVSVTWDMLNAFIYQMTNYILDYEKQA